MGRAHGDVVGHEEVGGDTWVLKDVGTEGSDS